MAEDGSSGHSSVQDEDVWRLRHHEMRQPLNALGLFCEALKMQPLSPAQQPLVQGIAQAAESIERLVDQHFAGLRGGPAARPLGRTPATVPVSSPEPAMARTSAGPARSSCRILVVDDDHAARTGLVMLLEAWGASAWAFGGIEPLQQWLWTCVEDAPPDLLILDYHLPRPGDGLQALRLLREAWPGRAVHALLITGDERAAVANALTDGSLECLVKPVTPAPLLAALRRRLGAQFGV